jgi:prepilin-type N-terminal cleavage/methylation domain-containing protein
MKRCTNNSKGFTLIELLVVIAIIALLLSILMPALGRVKKQAQSIVCRTNVKQTLLGLYLYAEDYGGKFVSLGSVGGDYWFHKIAPYLGKDSDKDNMGGDMEIIQCPSAKPNPTPVVPDPRLYVDAPTTAFKRWNWQGTEGSYGLNLWLTSEYNDWNEAWSGPGYYRKWSDIRQPVPVLGDSMWVGSWPNGDNVIPANKDAVTDAIPPMTSALDTMMDRFCLNRHNMAISVGFSDMSVDKVQIEDLWTLAWKKDPIMNGNVKIH